MAKPEWGTKRTCPECSARFYDLGKGDPATCVACGHVWKPVSLLKSRQAQPTAPKPKPADKSEAESSDSQDTDSADDGSEVATDTDNEADETPVPATGDDGDNPDLESVIEKK